MLPFRYLTGSALLAVLASGCGESPTASVCDRITTLLAGVPALKVEVREAGTSAPLAAGSIVWYQHRSVRDSLRTSGLITIDGKLVPYAFSGGLGAGEYYVEVQKPGYQTWTANVSVRQGPCDLITTSFTAHLTALPGTP